MKKKKISIFYKYLVSFFLVAMIPIGIAVVFFYQYNITSLKKQTEIINRQKLKQSAKLLDEVVYNHLRTASAISVEPSLQMSRLTGGIYDQYECLATIKPYLNRNQEWEKGFLIMKEGDRVYSDTGIMSLSTLCKITLNFTETQETALREKLKEIDNYTIIGSDVFENYLIFIHPVPNFRSYAYLVYFMELKNVKNIFSEEFGEEKIFIIHGENQVLVSDFINVDFTEYSEISSENKNVENEILIYESDMTNLTYGISFSADNIIFKELRYKRIIMLLVCFFIFFLCMVLAFTVASFTYRPIRNLLNLMDKPVELKDEMSVLYEYMENRKELTDSIHWQTPYVQQRIMEFYLEELADIKEVDKAFDEFQFGLEENCYFVMIIGLQYQSGTNNSYYRQEILNFSLELELRQNVHICHMEKIKESYIVWVINSRSPDEAANLVLSIRQEMDYFIDKEKMLTLLGVGSCVKELNQIRSSYYEALAAGEYLKNHPKGQLLFYKDLSKLLQKEELQDGEGLLKLVQSLRKGDKVLSQELFFQYFEELHQNYHSQILFRYFTVKSFKFLKDSLSEYVPDDLTEKLVQIISIEDRVMQMTQMKQFLCDVCDYRIANQKSTQLDLTNKILDFIRKNAFLSSLSLEQMGDEFGLSPYYISRFMAEQTGVGLKNYITKLRMEEAKRLLTETNLPLYEIVAQIGYLDVSSFIRKFKRETGMTPGEYREGYKNAEKNS